MTTATLENRIGSKKLYDSNIEDYETLPSPRGLITDIPISKYASELVTKTRREIGNILDKNEYRKIIILGPCSIHDVQNAIKYGEKIKKLSEQVSDELLLVMRTYFEKPRTVIGWTGLVYDPYLDGSYNIGDGLRVSRELLRDLNEKGIPCATEFVGSVVPQYIADFISWAAIGASTTESQVHRQLASGLSMPIGFKNSTSGDIQVAVDASKSAGYSHKFIGIDVYGNTCAVRTKGNPHAHIVLRGGNGTPNYKSEIVNQTLKMLEKAGIQKSIIIDCSHGNSEKKHEKQIEAGAVIREQILSGNEDIVGVMYESNNKSGKQKFPETSVERENLDSEISITDACIGWEETEKEVLKWYEDMKSRKKNV